MEFNSELTKALAGISMGVLMVYALYVLCWMFDCRVWTTPHPDDVVVPTQEPLVCNTLEEDPEAQALHVRRESMDSHQSEKSQNSHQSEKSQNSQFSQNSVSSELSNLSQQPLK